MSDQYRGERMTGGQLVFGQDGSTLEKATDVVDIHSGGFDWGEDANEEKLLQLATALLNDRLGEEFARKYHHGFAAYLKETLEDDEWTLAPSEIGSQNYARETPFKNRCDEVDDPTDDEGNPGTSNGEEVSAAERTQAVTDGRSQAESSGEAGEGSGDSERGPDDREGSQLEDIGHQAVDDALEAVAEEQRPSSRSVPAIDFEQADPPEDVMNQLRVEIGKKAVSEQVSRDALKDTAFARLEQLSSNSERISPFPRRTRVPTLCRNRGLSRAGVNRVSSVPQSP